MEISLFFLITSQYYFGQTILGLRRRGPSLKCVRSEMDLRGTGTSFVLGLQQSMTSSHTSVFISEKGLSLFRELHGVASRFVKCFLVWPTVATILKAKVLHEVFQCVFSTAL